MRPVGSLRGQDGFTLVELMATMSSTSVKPPCPRSEPTGRIRRTSR